MLRHSHSALRRVAIIDVRGNRADSTRPRRASAMTCGDGYQTLQSGSPGKEDKALLAADTGRTTNFGSRIRGICHDYGDGRCIDRR
jgi:hypothetical protein